MANLSHILSEIRGLSSTELTELSEFLQHAFPSAEGAATNGDSNQELSIADEFDADLNAVLISAPPLPPSFSRDDIYDDHE